MDNPIDSLSEQQANAIKAVKEWFHTTSYNLDKPFFKLMGYAGTGKTTLAKIIAGSIKGKVLFAAFTGKAAVVMQKKGCSGASTIHSLIYVAEEDEDGVITYKLNENSVLTQSRLLIIDECSMVNESLALDLLSFEIPILVLGDTDQLPPVGGEGYFTSGEPDFMLTEIHRQAESNPIIAMSMAARHHMTIPVGKYNESKVIKSADFDYNELVDADQVICGTNKMRMALNEKIRLLKGFTSEVPEVGERLVCLKNDKKHGLLNGSLWDVLSIKKQYANSITLSVGSVDFDLPPRTVYIHNSFFKGEEHKLNPNERKRYHEFTWGYALTGHKCQGSQFNNVVVFDESAVFREEQYRWLYTAITRAAERLTLVV